MVKGIGIDVLEIRRMEEVVSRWGNKFLDRVFTEGELEYARSRKNPIYHIAGRFAVKEAVAKALATGWAGGFRWKDVEVRNDAAGKPAVIVRGNVEQILASSRILVSISHAESVVVATAIIESPDGS